MTPYEKMSPKAKKEFDRRKRRVWAICPVTRKPKKSSAYDRAKTKNVKYED